MLILNVHRILRIFRKPFIECCSGFWQTQIIHDTKQHHFVESPREWHGTFWGGIMGFPAPGWNSCFGIPRARASRLWAQYLCPWLWSGWVKGQSLAVHGRFGSSLLIWNDMRWYYLNLYEIVWDALRWYENISSIEWFPDRFILQFMLIASFAFYSFSTICFRPFTVLLQLSFDLLMIAPDLPKGFSYIFSLVYHSGSFSHHWLGAQLCVRACQSCDLRWRRLQQSHQAGHSRHFASRSPTQDAWLSVAEERLLQGDWSIVFSSRAAAEALLHPWQLDVWFARPCAFSKEL